MASNHTENYSLCQWQGDDPFTHMDFNEDNLAIDRALKSISDRVAANPTAIIASVHTERSVNELALNLEAIDMTQYASLELLIHSVAEPVASVPQRIYLNGRKETIYTHYDSLGADSAQTDYFMTTPIESGGCHSRRVIFTSPDYNIPVAAQSLILTGNQLSLEMAFCPDIHWQDLQSINIKAQNSTVPFKAGSYALLVGIKSSQ